jgi:DNA invertase Pin-like site-specific DNA recombinase
MRKAAKREPDRVRAVRCAVYTRKSTEDGLEQEFNSLDAQREACAAYITSQRHEGWTLALGDYDDGGFSGGTLDRPALKRLLGEVAAGKVDVIVVYKIDRLTRSLADFSRIVDVLDEANASFVSVTQAFNTTTSMGRLTLNVLLSFAQFEREVTGERIRDKIAASKAKGMWMGGVVPLGYRVQDRKLLIEHADAEQVRHIFQRYLALGSVQALEAELEAAGMFGRARSIRGEIIPPKPMSRGALYLLLSNRIYLGEICHKDKAYPGEHEQLVDTELFERAQSLLESNRNNQHLGTGSGQPSLLAGILWDAHGRRMSPSHAVKQRVKRYRYYVSRLDGAAREQAVWRVPAGDLETLVTGRIRALLADDGELLDLIGGADLDAVSLHSMLFEAKRRAELIGCASAQELRELVLPLLARVEVHEEQVRLHVRPAAVRELGGTVHVAQPGEADVELTIVAKFVRGGGEVRLVIAPSHEGSTARRDPGLTKLIVKAAAARAAVEAAGERTVDEVAASQGHAREYFGVLLRLGYLAPDIVAAVLDGSHPANLTRQKLMRMASLPVHWRAQRQALGFNVR